MRWLFLLLVLLNAGFFVWQYSQQKSSEARPSTLLGLPPDSTIQTLILLREAGPTATATQAVPEVAGCYTIGPFMTAEEAQRATTMLETEGFTSQARVSGTQDNPEHRLDISATAGQPAPPISDILWQTLISVFPGIQQQPRSCNN